MTLLSAVAVGANANGLTGAGSSAAAPIYRSWGQAYEKATGQKLSYEAVGSSAGVRKIVAREVGFGATDVAPSNEELKKSGLALFPVAISGIAPVINLPKVGDGQLRLTGPVLARIFMGQITQWNAAEIVQLNPGLVLPNLPIKVIVRNDGSGTTYNFADYLAKVQPEWQEKFGVKTTITWPENFASAKGSDGVSTALRDTVGGITYVDISFARDYKLSTVQLKNLAGDFVAPSNEAFRAALASSEWIGTGNFTSTLTEKPGRGAWPITMGTFVLVPLVTDNPKETTSALKFMAWAFTNGDSLVQQHSFVRLPTRLQTAAFKVIAGVKDTSGTPIGMQVAGF